MNNIAIPSAFIADTPPDPPIWLSPEEARQKLGEEIAEFLRLVANGDAEGIALAIRATAGIGKTGTLLRLLGETAIPLLALGHIQFMVPTHDLAAEARREFARLFPEIPSMVLRGRDATNPESGESMCLKSALVKPIGEIVGNVSEALCQVWDPAAGRMRKAMCRRACPWYEQIPKSPTVIFLAHAYLTAGFPVPGDVVLRIIDEKFFSNLLVENTVSAGNWLPKHEASPPPSPLEARLDEAREVVFQALRTGRPVNESLRQHGFARAEIDGFRAHELQTAPRLSIHPLMLKEEQHDLVEGFDLWALRAARARARVWQAIHASWGRPGCDRLALESEGPKSNHFVIRIHRRDEINQAIPMLMIDADADPAIVETVRPGTRFLSLDVRPNAEIVQIRDRNFSNASLLDRPKAETLRREVLKVVEREVASADGRGVLLVATSSVLRRLHLDVDPAGPVDQLGDLLRPLLGADSRWFGPRLQGVNTYKDFETVILLGRLEPPVTAIDAQLRAFSGDDDVPPVFAANPVCGWLPEQQGWYLRSDNSFELAKVRQHPDPRGAALLAQTREAHLLQAMARTRSVGAATRKRIVILCSIPLVGVPVDDLVKWQEFVTGVPVTLATKVAVLRQAIRRPDGSFVNTLRLSVGGLLEDAPHVFPKEKDARTWREDLPTERLPEVIRHVEVAERVRIALVALPRKAGGRNTPALVLTAVD